MPESRTVKRTFWRAYSLLGAPMVISVYALLLAFVVLSFTLAVTYPSVRLVMWFLMALALLVTPHFLIKYEVAVCAFCQKLWAVFLWPQQYSVLLFAVAMLGMLKVFPLFGSLVAIVVFVAGIIIAHYVKQRRLFISIVLMMIWLVVAVASLSLRGFGDGVTLFVAVFMILLPLGSFVLAWREVDEIKKRTSARQK
ncbi:MAG: hypothetical protein OXR68_02295 [Alphaproteobacteria bacterium]|nr:hypothetical protein [Alphaproteobacteria bacterium]MDD9919439.1 hypothetical protein [Alphaproteobacteria bacterium]